MKEIFFEANPNPMWIYEPESLQIKAANTAAVNLYGYSKDEMLSLTLKDLRPDSEIPKLQKEIDQKISGFNDAGIWLHKKKKGDQLFVRILSYPIEWEKKKCRLVVAQNVSEQKDIERQYVAQQELLDVLVQSLPGIFFVFDRNGNLFRWNNRVSEITGYTDEEIEQLSVTDFFGGDERENVTEAAERAFKRGTAELKVNFSAGESGKAPYYFRIGRFEYNGIFHLIGIGTDISSLNEAELKGKQNRMLLQAITEQAGSVITVKDGDGRYLHVNRRFCELFDLDREEVIGKRLSDVYGNEIAEILEKSDRKVREKGGMIETEENFETSSGARSFVVVKYPLRDVPGYENSICSIATDITPQKEAEKELQDLYEKEKDKRLRIERINSRLKLLEKVGDFFAEDRTDYRSSLKKVSDLLTEEVAEICAFDIYDDGSLSRAAQSINLAPEKKEIIRQNREKYPTWFYNTEIFKKAVSGKEPLLEKRFTDEELKKEAGQDEQFELIRQLGIRSYFLLPLIDSNQDVIGVATLIITRESREFTEDDRVFLAELADKVALYIENSLINEKMRKFNRRLEQKVSERTKQLENTNEELESFSYSVSHDLRTPLRAIAGYSNLLIEDYRESLDEEGQEFLAIINNETKRMGTLIDDLLSFSRLSRKEKIRKSFSMTTLVRDCIDEVLKVSDTAADIKIGDLPEVSGDPKLLRQVWVNLIGNAVKYRKNGQKPEITIGTCPADRKNRITFYIRDNGVGFNMEYADKLFGVFQRLHSEDEFEGTGIGLALVRRIVNRHGGDVWAESEVGEGSTFYFSLPHRTEMTNKYT